MSGPPVVEPLTDRAPDAVLFQWRGRPITAAAFVHDAMLLADTLPAAGPVVNLCRDRYAFAVGFAAALLRQQVSLLTGDQSVKGLAELAARFPGVIAVADDVAPGAIPLPVHTVRPSAIPPARHSAMPGIPAGQPAAIVFTSGSTGAPVPHQKSWGALVARSRAAAVAFGLDAAVPRSVVGTVPPHHMYGFELTVLLPLHAPVTSWCDAAFFPGDVHAALSALPAPRILVTTPLQIRALLHAGTGLPPLSAAISATAPLDPVLAAGAEARWQAPLLEIFGATEVGSIASRRTLDGNAWTAYPGLVIRQDRDGTTVSAPWAEPMALADQIEPLDDNRFRLLGRRTDLVKLGGRRASLSGLNQVLLALDGVADGAFVVPDDLEVRANARLSAIVVAPCRSPREILADLRGRVDPLFLPRRVICVDSLPRNALGKLPRHALLALLAAAPP
ncbi:MAG: AMP-binding protein [Gemmatimonadaceae bacterium]|nr:AMP-binding protein [Acetobacteraceae bacterium]